MDTASLFVLATVGQPDHRRTLGTQLPRLSHYNTHYNNDDNKPDLDITAAHNCGIAHQLLFPPHITSPCASTSVVYA